MKFYALLFFFSVFTSCIGQNLTKHGENNKTKESLTTEISELNKRNIFNGFAVAIVNNKGTLYQKGFGFSDSENKKPYTDSTIQTIASVSKTLVGIALLKAQELGKLKLDDPVNDYLNFKVVNPNFPNEAITIRHLATHTSSIVDNEFYLKKNYYLKENQHLENVKLHFDDEQLFNSADSILTMQSFLKNILDENGKWNENSYSADKPGSLYEYSNIGTALAALVIEKATGTSFSKFTENYILKPLKMNQSGWSFKDVSFGKFSRLYENPATVLPYYEMITYPDGGFITSVNDLSIFLTELIKGYNGNGSLLTKESYKTYFTPLLSDSNFTDRNTQNPYSESYNVGIFIGFGYSGFIGHTGGDPGVLSMMFFDPKTNLGRIMIFNTNFSDKAGNDTFYGIWNKLEKYQAQLAE